MWGVHPLGRKAKLWQLMSTSVLNQQAWFTSKNKTRKQPTNQPMSCYLQSLYATNAP